MRVLLLHSSSDLYGASKVFLQTVLLLQKKGYKCTVVLSGEGPLSELFIKNNIEVYFINLGILRRKYFTPKGIINRIQQWTKASRLLKNIILKKNIQCIYSNTAAVLIGAYVAQQNKIKHIWHIHEIIEKPYFLHIFIKWCLQYGAQKIIVVSKAVQLHWGIGTIVYNGIESLAISHKENYKSKFNIPSNAIVIGMAARIHYWKGQQYFLEIAEQLIATENRNEPVYFLISGDAFPGYEYLLDEMKAFIKEHTLNSRVFYIGFETEMDNFYKSIDVLVLPSQLPDPLPTVVLEAMRYGLPIAATEQGGALEMIHENGIFLPLFDAYASAKKIGSILPSEIRKKLGQAGQKRAEAFFSVTAFENNILHVFET